MLRLGFIDLKVRMNLLERKKLGISRFVGREAELLVVWTVINMVEPWRRMRKKMEICIFL